MVAQELPKLLAWVRFLPSLRKSDNQKEKIMAAGSKMGRKQRKPSSRAKDYKNPERNNGKAWKQGLAPDKR